MSLNYDLSPEQYARIQELRNCSPEKWDSICKGCGICCLHKVNMEIVPGVDQIAFTNLCCNHLDTKTKKCTIYNKRQKICHNCAKVTLDLVLDGELLPAGCGYVEYIFGPAPRPAKVDWNAVRPVVDIDTSREEVLPHIIMESLWWRHR